jgi:hypothetical protein
MGDDTQQQLDDLRALVAGNHADIAALREGAADATRRADAEAARFDTLEARARVDHDMIVELQADGLLSREHAENLEAALQSSRLIGAAVGIVMAFYGVPEGDAFEILKKASMDSNLKLRVLAEEVVVTRGARGLPPR